MTKHLAAPRLVLLLLSQKSNVNSFILKFVEGSTYYHAECTLQPNHNITNDRVWRIHDDGSNCHFAVQKPFLASCEMGRSLHFTKDMLSISQLICKRLGRESNPPSYYSCMTLTVCPLRYANIFTHAVLSISPFPKGSN